MYFKCSVGILMTVGLATASVSGSAIAEEMEEEKTEKLSEMTVQAARTGKPVSAIPNTVTILDVKDIRTQTAISDDVQSILEKTVPGFGPSLKKLVGRGESFRGRNPLYLIDGVPQHNALRDGQRDGHTIDTDFIEKIEVIHGSNSIQGIGATGGVINLVTKSPRYTDKWSNDVKVGLTTHDSFDSDSLMYKGSYIGGMKKNNFDVTTGIAFHKRDLFFDANGDRVGLYGTQGDIMDSESRDIFFKVGYEPDENQRIQIMLNDFNIEGDGDYIPIDGDRTIGKLGNTADGDPRPTLGDPTENDVTTITLNYTHDDIYSGNLSTQFYYQDFAAKFQGGTFGTFFQLTPGGPAFLDQSQIESEKLGGKFMYSLNNVLLDGLNPTIGVDITRDESAQVLVKSNREWVPKTELEGVAPFMQVDYTVFDRVHLTSGLRYEIVEVNIDDFTTIASSNSTFVSGGSPSFETLLPNIGVSFEALQNLKFYASYAEGFTMPDIGRITRAINTAGQDIDSLIEIEPVITENIEIGIDYNYSRGSFHTAYYWSDSDVGSRLETTAANIFEVRREKTAIQGFDIAADYDLTSNFTVGANYAYIVGEYDSDLDGTVDTDFDGVNIEPDRLNVFINADLDNGLNGRLQVSHLFARDFGGIAAPSAAADFDGYTVVDLYLNKEVGNGEVSLGIDNVLDKQFVTYFSQTDTNQSNNEFFVGNGRTVSLIYNHKF
jgi:iron complex outermembrane receptor protein